MPPPITSALHALPIVVIPAILTTEALMLRLRIEALPAPLALPGIVFPGIRTAYLMAVYAVNGEGVALVALSHDVRGAVWQSTDHFRPLVRTACAAIEIVRILAL